MKLHHSTIHTRTPLLTALLFSVLAACASGPSVAPPPSASSPNITQDEIAYHVAWLSSDELEGRGTGTRANDVAAKYIAREFERYGLLPAGTEKYLQPFDVVTGVELGDENSFIATIGNNILNPKIGTDYTPLGFSMSGAAEGTIIVVGYGINSPAKEHDDYKNSGIKGNIALAFSGHPEEDNPHSEYGMAVSLRSKALFAREAGAGALLVVNPDRENLYELKFDNSAANAGVPVINISTKLANELLSAAGTNVEDVMKKLQQEKNDFKAFPIKNSSCRISADVNLIHNITNNVVGVVEGSEPSLQNQYIVVGGHYDHLGWGQEGTLYKGAEPMIHNGADDNASGTAGVLELAQYFSAHKPKHTMIFMAFSGEEMGLLGSAHWVQHPTMPVENITAMFNFDMIGRLPDSTRKLNIQGTGTSPLWETVFTELEHQHKFDIAKIKDGRGASDQSSFYMKDIPVLFFFTGLHSQYHRPTDDFELINVPGQKDVLDFAAKIIERVDAEQNKLAFTKVKGDESRQMRAFNIYVGTIPDYGADEEGFKISGTSPGGPAEKAGMQSGDIIVKFGETDVKSIYDYMNALSLHKPGEKIPVIIKRGTETLTLTVKPTKK